VKNTYNIKQGNTQRKQKASKVTNDKRGSDHKVKKRNKAAYETA